MVLVCHGTQKLFGWFGGHGSRRTGAFFELLGYRPGVLFAVIAGLSEAGGGVLFAVGFLTPLAGAAVIGVMLNAASSLRGRGPWVSTEDGSTPSCSRRSARRSRSPVPGTLPSIDALGSSRRQLGASAAWHSASRPHS